ncbi:FAD binding domain-containing protein [Streptomyces sp. NPDC005012]|uniref:FAD binding domain-containing protein n=1 Tax=unclassified Streptomyces TaxID=2593676 RepID=UPI0033B7AEC1
MQLHLPRTVSEAQRHLAEGAVPIGGATLVWATWQRDGFPEQAVSLRQVPEANVVEAEALGAAVLLHQVDDRVPAVLRRAAGTIGTGAVRRTATVGGNIVGSSLRCLLPAALVLDARATVLEAGRTYDTDLAEVVAKRSVLLSLRWRAPLADGYLKLPADAGGPPPLVVATAVHAEPDGRRRVRVAVRDGYEVTTGDAAYDDGDGVPRILDALARTPLGDLPPGAREQVEAQVDDVLARA